MTLNLPLHQSYGGGGTEQRPDPDPARIPATLYGTHAYGEAEIPYRNWDEAIFSVQTDFCEFTDYGQPRVRPRTKLEAFIAGPRVLVPRS